MLDRSICSFQLYCFCVSLPNPQIRIDRAKIIHEQFAARTPPRSASLRNLLRFEPPQPRSHRAVPDLRFSSSLACSSAPRSQPRVPASRDENTAPKPTVVYPAREQDYSSTTLKSIQQYHNTRLSRPLVYAYGLCFEKMFRNRQI
jgi:hypothetical protein